MNEDIGCLCSLAGCIVGAVTVLIVGHFSYEWIMQLALTTDVFAEPPDFAAGGFEAAGGGKTVGQSMGFVISFYALSFLFVIIGLITGVVASGHLERFSHWWSYQTREPIIVLTLLNGIATFITSGILTSLFWVYFVHSKSMQSSPYEFRFRAVVAIVILLSVGLLSLNFFLPRLVRRMAER